MIGYFFDAGDENASKMFKPYVWQEHGFATLFENKFANKIYGSDLKLLLIIYYVEGKFGSSGPEHPKLGNYIKKNKDINVSITVKPEQFHDRNEFERREFVLDSTLNAVTLVRNKLVKMKLNIKFDELITDIKLIGNAYLKYENLLS